jgi:hypothetical protein
LPGYTRRAMAPNRCQSHGIGSGMCPKAFVEKATSIDQHMHGLFVVIVLVCLWLTGRKMNTVLYKGHVSGIEGAHWILHHRGRLCHSAYRLWAPTRLQQHR